MSARLSDYDYPLPEALIAKRPLPPYISRESDFTDSERYQTVFAQTPGALAAPTAGLHFTPGILSEIPHAFVTLHVGPGTFRPVHSENITEHQMHPESFSISPETVNKIGNAKHIVAVGTTTVRVLETVACEARRLKAVEFSKPRMVARKGETDLFIYPPFK